MRSRLRRNRRATRRAALAVALALAAPGPVPAQDMYVDSIPGTLVRFEMVAIADAAFEAVVAKLVSET